MGHYKTTNFPHLEELVQHLPLLRGFATAEFIQAMQLVTISTVDARQEGAAVAVAPAFVVEATRHAFVDAVLVAVGGVSWLHTAAFLDVVQPAVVVLVPVKSVEKVAVRTRGPAVVVVEK